MRIKIRTQPIQKSGSNAFIDRMLSIIRWTGAMRIASPARAWANAPPPSCLASRTVNATTAAPASSDSTLNDGNEPPSNSAIFAYTATSGAQST